MLVTLMVTGCGGGGSLDMRTGGGSVVASTMRTPLRAFASKVGWSISSLNGSDAVAPTRVKW